MNLKILEKKYQIVHCSEVPKISQGSLFSLSITADEISLVCEEETFISHTTKVEKGWKALKIEAVLDFNLVGILANISSTLAKESISIFAISTYNTDYILIKEEILSKACVALEAAGHRIVS